MVRVFVIIFPNAPSAFNFSSAIWKILDPNHVSKSPPPELFVSNTEGRQPADATYNSIVSIAIDPARDHEPPPTVVDRGNDLLEGSGNFSTDSEWTQTDTRVGTPLLEMEKPESIRPSSMVGFSQMEFGNLGRTLPSNQDVLPYFTGELIGIHPHQFSNGPTRREFLIPPEPLPSSDCIDISSLPPHGNSPKDHAPDLTSFASQKSTRSNSPETNSKYSSTGPMIQNVDLTSNTQTPQTTINTLHHPEYIAGKKVQQAISDSILVQPLAGLDDQDDECGTTCISNHQLSSFDASVRQDSALVGQDLVKLSIDQSNRLEYIAEQKDDRAPISHVTEYQRSSFITPNLPEAVPDEPGRWESISEESVQPSSLSKEIEHLESFIKEPDDSDYSNAIFHWQSRSESIKSHRPSKDKDLRLLEYREAKLHRLRWRSLKTRALVCEKRSELHQVRSDMIESESEFVNFSRQVWVNSNANYVPLKASFEKLQTTRNIYGALEEEYNRLEERLDREEFELAELEEKLLKSGNSVMGGQESEQESPPSNFGESAFDSLEVMNVRQSPLYEEFLSRLGDSSLHQEAYSYLLAEHESLLEAEEKSQRHGRTIPVEDQMLLNKFISNEQKMLEEQRKIDSDVERLRLECIRLGVLPEEVGAEIDILYTLNGSVHPQQAGYKKFPQLLDQPGTKEDEERSKELLSKFKSGDTGDRITRWLLHKLRSSCSEVELLAQFTEGLDRKVDVQKWQEEVLCFWYTDSAILPPSAYEYDPTTTATPSLEFTDPEKVQQKPFGEKHFIELVVRSSSMSTRLEFGMLLKIARMKGKSAVTG